MKKTVIEQLHEHQATAVAALADADLPTPARTLALTALSILATQMRLWYLAQVELLQTEEHRLAALTLPDLLKQYTTASKRTRTRIVKIEQTLTDIILPQVSDTLRDLAKASKASKRTAAAV